MTLDDPVEFRPVELGVWMDLRNPSQWERPWAEHYQYSLELAERAEAAGLDRIGIAEHHFFPDGYIPQPLIFAAAVAARTRRVRIGTSIMIPGLRASVDVAEQAAVVDLLSGGRLELGFGVGYRIPEYQIYGVDIKLRWQRFENSVNELWDFWKSGPVTPRPIQDPIPIIGGFSGPRGMRIAGRLGLPLLSLRDEVEPYLLGLEEGGHGIGSARQEGYLHGILVDDPERSLAQLGPYVENFWNVYLDEDARGTGKAARRSTASEMLKIGPRLPAGFALLTVDQAARLVIEVSDGRPVTNVCFWATIPGIPYDVAFRNLELIGELRAGLSTTRRQPWRPTFTDAMRQTALDRSVAQRRSVFQ